MGRDTQAAFMTRFVKDGRAINFVWLKQFDDVNPLNENIYLSDLICMYCNVFLKCFDE